MLQKITEHVYVLEHQPEVDRPWIGYVKGDASTVLIDSGNSSEHIRLIRENLKETGLPDPRFVVLTHSHWDHSYGLAGWHEAVPGIETFAGEETARILRKMQGWKWDMDEFEAHIETNEIPLFCREHMLLEYPELCGIRVELPRQSIRRETVIELGKISVICKPVESPHTDDAVIYYVPEDRVLFLGDAYCEEVIGTDWIDRPEKRAALTQVIKELNPQLVVTGHHGVLTLETYLSMFGGEQ